MSDKSIIEQIKHYQRDILKCPDNSKRMIRCIERLNVLPIKIAHLQETGVGKSVNELRKCGGEVGAAANALVCKWKDMVREDEEDEDSTSGPDDETKDIDVPPDFKNNLSKNNLKDKYSNKKEESKKVVEVSSIKQTETPEIRSSKNRDYREDFVTSEERRKDSKSNHESRSGSKAYSEKLQSKSQTKHNGDSDHNGVKKEKYEMKDKNRHFDTKNAPSTKHTSHDKYKDIKETDKSTSHKSLIKPKSTSKQEIKREETESSEDEAIYKPSNRKRKKSYSSNEDEYEKRDKHKIAKKTHSSNTNSEESDVENDSDDQERGSAAKYNSKSSESENNSSPERSYSENVSNKGSDSENEFSDRVSEDMEKNHSKSDSESSQEEESDRSSEKYVPVKIKREKVSPPRQSQSSPNKYEKTKYDNSHKRCSNSSSSTKSSKSSEVKIKKEKDERVTTNHKHKPNRHESDKKNQHSSSSTHRSSSQNKFSEKKVKVKIEKKEDGSIDCESGASFGDALLGLGDSNKKSMKKKPTVEKEKVRGSTSKVSSNDKPKTKSDRQDSSSTYSSGKSFKVEPDLLKHTVKLEPLDVDLKSTLPEISPNYKPMPHYSPPGSPASKRSKLLSHEEALSTMMSNKNQRTKVFSGNKTGYVKVPSLFELCTHVLRDNIDALEYTGGVPYDLLKPVLNRATADQLYQLEHYNPYLIEDTNGLWQFHCNKDFRGKKPDEFETWRELYLRCLDEREKKLEALKTNITQSMAKSQPVRKTKLAYVDSVVKPPRNVAKQQMKFGTGKHELVSKAMMGQASSSPAPPPVSVPAPPHPRPNLSNSSFPIPNFLKKKKAPLMAKTLQLMKGSNRFKR